MKHARAHPRTAASIIAPALLIAAGACGHPARRPVAAAAAVDPDGPHRAAVAGLVRPFLDGELTAGLVIGLYDAGKLEIYGFGQGPGGKAPTGRTLFELGSVTQIYTSLLLADAVTKHEVALDTPVSELLPPGVTVPTRDRRVINLGHLARHRSGLPKVPPSLAGRPPGPDPYAAYNEDALYADLAHADLLAPPGAAAGYSDFAAGLLGFALGRKLGSGYETALRARVLGPLHLDDTFVTVPAAAAARRAAGVTPDFQPAPPWTFVALAGAAGLVSTARDQLALIDAELGPPRALAEMIRLTQAATPGPGDAGDDGPDGLGWMHDGAGRLWHSGTTGGGHAFLGVDAKHRRGVVILAATATSAVDRLAGQLYEVLDGGAPLPLAFPTAADLGAYAGTYDLSGTPIAVEVAGKRIYVQAPGEPRVRLMPLSEQEFFLEELQGLVAFERAKGDDQGPIQRLVLIVGGNRIAAARVK